MNHLRGKVRRMGKILRESPVSDIDMKGLPNVRSSPFAAPKNIFRSTTDSAEPTHKTSKSTESQEPRNPTLALPDTFEFSMSVSSVSAAPTLVGSQHTGEPNENIMPVAHLPNTNLSEMGSITLLPN